MFSCRLIVIAAPLCIALTMAACSPVEEEGADRSGSSVSVATTATDGTGASSVSVSSQTGGSSSSSSAVSTGGGVAVSEANDFYEFEYSWPAAAAIPGLADELQKRVERAKSLLGDGAREDGNAAKTDGYTFNQHYWSAKWLVAADTPRFLSLTADVASYTGGAHGNYGMDSLIWDRQESRALDPKELFASTAALGRAISTRYCRALDKQREERRGAPVIADDLFGECPAAKDLEIILGSRKGRTFDRIGLYAAPYVAGSYAEGDYEITLPVDEAILAAVKPEYRGAFSVRK